ncbi:MAG: hypothetical protein AAF502_05010 [Bacteroidota bacterium]
MSLTTLAASAAGYILKAFGKSKIAEHAKKELVETFDKEVKGLWSWIKPIFQMKAEEKLVSKVESAPLEEKTLAVLEWKIEELLEEDDSFKSELEEKVEKLKAIENQIFNIENIQDAGIVNLGGTINIQGENVSGRDMTININKSDTD